MHLILLDPVPVCLYMPGDPEPAGFDGLAYPYLLDPGETQESADWETGGTVPNHNVTLLNQAGEATALLAIPPISARLEEDGQVLFEGRIGGITLSDTCRLELVA